MSDSPDWSNLNDNSTGDPPEKHRRNLLTPIFFTLGGFVGCTLGAIAGLIYDSAISGSRREFADLADLVIRVQLGGLMGLVLGFLFIWWAGTRRRT